jgi:hypothetical protein
LDCALSRPSIGTGGSKCKWSPRDGSCSFIEPSEDITIVIFIAILSAVISTPIAIAEGIIIHNYLAAATRGNSNSDSPNSDRQSFFFQQNVDDQKFSILAKKNMNELIAAKNSYREALTTSQRRADFDGNLLKIL